MIDRIRSLADQAFPHVVALRRALHRRPELEFDCEETADVVQQVLRDLRIPFRSGVARTGVVASIQGTRPGPSIALRADMDALPILEATGADYASEIPGRMHACGHDAHTASLLGVASVLTEMREHLSGSVRLLFQPSEEKLPGGAPSMIAEGALETDSYSLAPETIFGQHVSPDLPTGTIGIRAGRYMASADEIYITVEGQGGHAAAPHNLSADAVLAASQIVVSLQSVISRNRPPASPSVLSIGRIVAEGATNVIPERALLVGTLRAMDESWRRQAHGLIERVATATAAAFGARADVDLRIGYPHLENDPEAAAFVRSCAEAYVGPESVADLDIWFAGEDFAYYLLERPGAFYRIGTGNASIQTTFGLHHPRFNIDEEALRTSVGFMAFLALRRTASL